MLFLNISKNSKLRIYKGGNKNVGNKNIILLHQDDEGNISVEVIMKDENVC